MVFSLAFLFFLFLFLLSNSSLSLSLKDFPLPLSKEEEEEEQQEQFFPRLKKVQIVGGEAGGGQENCGLFSLFGTFFNLHASVDKHSQIWLAATANP